MRGRVCSEPMKESAGRHLQGGVLPDPDPPLLPMLRTVGVPCLLADQTFAIVLDGTNLASVIDRNAWRLLCDRLTVE